MMQTTNQTALKNFVSVEELTNLEIMSLILRASEFKSGVQPDRTLTEGNLRFELIFREQHSHTQKFRNGGTQVGDESHQF
jgi:aspartate carbamoyltransferase catalytic subunit